MTTSRQARGLRSVAMGHAAAWLSCLLGLWACTGAMARDGGGGDPPGPAASFTLLWCGTTDDNEIRWRTGIKWSDRLMFGDATVRRDCVAMYEQWFALDVRTQGLSITTEEGYEATLRATLSRSLADRVPDAEFAGYILLDVEFLPLLWGKRTGGPDMYWEADHGPRQFDLWYAFIRDRRPEVMANLGTEAAERAVEATYNDAVRDWFRMLVRVSRELRPRAKFSFYGMPMGSRHANYTGQHEQYWRGRNDRCAWYVELQDAQMVPLYQDRFTVPAGQTPRGPYENTIEQGRDFIIANLAEAVRIGQGKPVYVLAMAKYMEYVAGHEMAFLSPTNRELMFRLPREAGADGLVMWDHIENQTQFQALQQYLNENVVPDLLAITAPGGGGETPPGGGGGGGDTPPGGGGGGGDTPPGGGGGGGDTPPGGGGGGGDAPPGGGGGGGDTPPGGGGGGGDTPPGGGGGGGDTPPGGGGGGGDTPPGGGGGGDTPPGGGGGGDGEMPPGGGGGGGAEEQPPDDGGGAGEPPTVPPLAAPRLTPSSRKLMGVTVRRSTLSSSRPSVGRTRISQPGDPRNTVRGSRPPGLRLIPRMPPIRVLPSSTGKPSS